MVAVDTNVLVRPLVRSNHHRPGRGYWQALHNLRFPVSRLLGLLAARESRESILSAYPYLEEADIDEALNYAACLSEDETIELRQ